MKIYNSKPNIDLSDILKFEKKIKFSFPSSYKEFLLKYNGGYPKEKDFNINQTNYKLYYFIPLKYGDYNQEIMINKLSRNTNDLFPFAIDNFGNYYAFNLRAEVVYWDILKSEQLKIFTNFELFLQSLKPKDYTILLSETVLYKTYQGKDYTKEEWKVFEEKEYRKYVEKRSGRKSSFLADDKIEKQNFSAESGKLTDVKYFVMTSKQDKVPVYEYPSTMAAPFTFLNNGTAIEVIKYEQNGWCEILSKEKKKAYIQSNHVKKNE